MRKTTNRKFYVLAESSSGLANVPMSIPKYYWLGVFSSKLEAIRGSHYTDIFPEVSEKEFGNWLCETQGDEFAQKWEDYIQEYETRYKAAIERLESGTAEEDVPMNVVELESPVEICYTRILASGSWLEIRDNLIAFLEENADSEDDEDGPHYRDMEEQSLVKRLQDFIDEHNETAYL